MQENGAAQPKVYRHTRIMLKIRSTPTEGEQIAQMKEWTTETRSIESNIPAIPYGTRDCVIGRSRGGMPGTCPPMRPNSFVFACAHIGGPCPPLMGAHPPYGKSWICHCV